MKTVFSLGSATSLEEPRTPEIELRESLETAIEDD
jgi:hypothetical protein